MSNFAAFNLSTLIYSLASRFDGGPPVFVFPTEGPHFIEGYDVIEVLSSIVTYRCRV